MGFTQEYGAQARLVFKNHEHAKVFERYFRKMFVDDADEKIQEDAYFELDNGDGNEDGTPIYFCRLIDFNTDVWITFETEDDCRPYYDAKDAMTAKSAEGWFLGVVAAVQVEANKELGDNVLAVEVTRLEGWADDDKTVYETYEDD